MSIKQIPPNEVFLLLRNSVAIRLIDVREPEEFSEVAAEFAENYPLSSFDALTLASGPSVQGSLYLVCRSGKRSMKAAEMLKSVGFTAIFNVEGGMLAWVAAGLPVVENS